MPYSSIRRHGLAIALAAAVIAPAQARTNNSTEAERAAAAPSAPTTAAASDRKYCIESDFTATRVQRRVCKTKKEWASQGVDVDQPAR